MHLEHVCSDTYWSVPAAQLHCALRNILFLKKEERKRRTNHNFRGSKMDSKLWGGACSLTPFHVIDFPQWFLFSIWSFIYTLQCGTLLLQRRLLGSLRRACIRRQSVSSVSSIKDFWQKLFLKSQVTPCRHTTFFFLLHFYLFLFPRLSPPPPAVPTCLKFTLGRVLCCQPTSGLFCSLVPRAEEKTHANVLAHKRAHTHTHTLKSLNEVVSFC